MITAAEPGARLVAVYPPRGAIVHLHLPGFTTNKTRSLVDSALCGASTSTSTPPPVGPRPTGRVKVPIGKAVNINAFQPSEDDPRPAWSWCANCLGRAALHYGLQGQLIKNIVAADAENGEPHGD
ncbi:hypothetical protein SEA_MUFASA8_72 [Arthrobacter phage Mufasa8]|uniref:Uncharacterized protein n=1 Tax=Arthrobacter phage Mufasa8 TaxID=2656526 RepID=A0A649VM68_9CAUD|nr:hypothetical protein HYQ08_gp072 [Arthrobacter phage Mufasa8]QGJ93520.1 hypothetical protein SEA_MUFASA8_72 [Arthrobacter phage Mufasa8]